MTTNEIIMIVICTIWLLLILADTILNIITRRAYNEYVQIISEQNEIFKQLLFGKKDN
ncbi:Uncharacterised protein [[Eubacterium] contortum]|uniref:Uncharacterized protein n=1 Tax=Faecalicatena contorta TaxID=39482 RepID=A0A174JPI8_9FIRM|nr:hypothetical protein [Faecalicatena contorta]CUO99080.1 Uncharacterised protein [[Eubacterium] contortum] [Faecalicatena contorta]